MLQYSLALVTGKGNSTSGLSPGFKNFLHGANPDSEVASIHST